MMANKQFLVTREPKRTNLVYNVKLRGKFGEEINGIIPNTPDGYSLAMKIKEGHNVYGASVSGKGIRKKQIKVVGIVPK